jgi:tape measure domain-containing protein
MGAGNTVEIILSAADRASGTIRSTFGTLESSSGRAFSIVKAGAALAVSAMAAAGGYVAKLGIDYDAMAEQSQVAWGTLLGSQAKAKQMLQDIANFAKSTPFETAQVDAMAKYMNNAGLSGKALFDQLMRISDVASAFNIPADSAQELARQMSQVMQSGTAYTEDLNVLGDRGVPILQALSKEMGVSVGEVKNMASNGKITSDVYMKAFGDVANSVKGASDAQSQTFNGLLSTLKDNVNMLAGALAKPVFVGLKNGLNTVMPLLGGLTSLAKGDFKGFSDAITQTFGENTGNKIIVFAQELQKGMQQVSGWIQKGKQAIQVLFDYLKGDNIGAINIMTKMGISTDMIVKVQNVVNMVKGTIQSFITNISNLFKGTNSWQQSITSVFKTAKSIVMPILTEIVSFVRQKLKEIQKFWNENGAMITQAVKNAWAVIAAVFKFIAPVILAILKMLWSTISGIISGALNVIMGLIKIFAGLFTGNWKKVWEGVKQLLSGAIQLIWNWINLLMFGRILGGIKSFATRAISGFKGFFTNAVNVFKNLDKTVWNVVRGFVSKIVSSFSNLYSQGARIFGTLRTFGANIFSSMGSAIRSVASSIYSNTIGRFSSMVSGVRGHFSSLLSTARSIFNSIKNAITSPIETARSLVVGMVSKIRSAFSNMGVNIPLPHFSVSNFSLNPADWVKDGLPKLSVKWYDKGGVFYGPSVIGVGEKRPEFVGALSDLEKVVRNAIGGKTGNTYNVQVNAGKVDMNENNLIRTLKRLEVLYG